MHLAASCCPSFSDNVAILDRLSSQTGDRTEASNREVAILCLGKPEQLAEIARGLEGQDAALAGDCAEVMTLVAEARPDIVAPYAQALAALIASKNTRVRWEAMHALSLLADLQPRVIGRLLPKLLDIVKNDKSVIVRDHAVDAVGKYAKTGRKAAQAARPILIEALTAWDGKQAGHALGGLANVASTDPASAAEIHEIAARYENHPRGVVRKAAKALLR